MLQQNGICVAAPEAPHTQQLQVHSRASIANASASNASAASASTTTGCSNYPVGAGASGPADEQHEENVATDAGVGGVVVASAFAEVNVT